MKPMKMVDRRRNIGKRPNGLRDKTAKPTINCTNPYPSEMFQ